MKVVSVVGARPQFVKAAVVCHALVAHSEIEHTLIHTGQHYDAEMSDVFFQELGLPQPAANLEVGSASHAVQTAEIMARLEPVLLDMAPDWVLVYGDTNSTLAAALVSSKLCVRQAHVEAGLRSFNRRMPEELNRIVADHLADLLLCPTHTSVANLEREGLAGRAVLTGDVMYDAALLYRDIARRNAADEPKYGPREFALATIHRAENTDNPQRLGNILEALETIAEDICPVILPLHPRTAGRLRDRGWSPRAISVVRPAPYLEMLLLESSARIILTDSGGVQKEAYFMRVPCITLRDETEWVETLENGCNLVVGADRDAIVKAARAAGAAGPWMEPYGDGHASEAIAQALLDHNVRRK